MNDGTEPGEAAALRRRRPGGAATAAGPAGREWPHGPNEGGGERPIAVRVGCSMLDRVDGLGVFALGWLYDPEECIRRVAVAGSGVRTDLLQDAVALEDPRSFAVLGIPAAPPARLVFPVLAAAEDADREGGLTFVGGAGAGPADSWRAKPTGSVGRLSGMFEALPLGDGLRLAAALVSAWRRCEARAPGLPGPIDEILGRVHRRIDKSANYGVGTAGRPVQGQVETAIRTDAAGLLVKGWLLHGAEDRVREWAAISLFGRRVGLPLPLPRLPRPDLPRVHDDSCGFVLFVPAPDLSPDERFWYLEAVFDSGQVRRLPFVCENLPTPRAAIETAFGFLKPIERNAGRLPELFREVLTPAVDRLWAAARREPAAVLSGAYGEPCCEPQVSVIVPLYRRIDFVHHQIARFSNDPEFRAERGIVELIYVLDDPAQREAFERLCRDVHNIYGVPFRTLVLDRNLGYSGANNVGAAAAAAPLLLLLNSDVLPKRPRWAGRLAQTYRSLEGCGILGCRLLLEDGAIEHAGMTFRQSPMLPGHWENEHGAKGLPVAFDRATGPIRVPAVTGACLMIERALFAALGGLSEEYVIGDFEDSDLCLKADTAGRAVYYTPEVELYHLERQSVKLLGEADWRQTLTLYNMWKHTRKWGGHIPALLDRLPG